MGNPWCQLPYQPTLSYTHFSLWSKCLWAPFSNAGVPATPLQQRHTENEHSHSNHADTRKHLSILFKLLTGRIVFVLTQLIKSRWAQCEVNVRGSPKMSAFVNLLANIPPFSSSTELHCPGTDGGGDGRATGQRGMGMCASLSSDRVLSRTSLTPFLSLSQWQGRFLDLHTESWWKPGGKYPKLCHKHTPGTYYVGSIKEQRYESPSVEQYVHWFPMMWFETELCAPQPTYYALFPQRAVQYSHKYVFVLGFFMDAWLIISATQSSMLMIVQHVKSLTRSWHTTSCHPPLHKRNCVDSRISGPRNITLLSSNGSQMLEM